MHALLLLDEAVDFKHVEGSIEAFVNHLLLFPTSEAEEEAFTQAKGLAIFNSLDVLLDFCFRDFFIGWLHIVLLEKPCF